MRTLILIPASIVLTAAGGTRLCIALGKNVHALELTWAIGTIAFACMAGVIPVLLTRQADQMSVSQAALLGSMIHMFAAIVPVGACIATNVPIHAAFISWLVPLYFITLTALVVVYARAIRSAPTATRSQKV